MPVSNRHFTKIASDILILLKKSNNFSHDEKRTKSEIRNHLTTIIRGRDIIEEIDKCFAEAIKRDEAEFQRLLKSVFPSSIDTKQKGEWLKVSLPKPKVTPKVEFYRWYLFSTEKIYFTFDYHETDPKTAVKEIKEFVKSLPGLYDVLVNVNLELQDQIDFKTPMSLKFQLHSSDSLVIYFLKAQSRKILYKAAEDFFISRKIKMKERRLLSSHGFDFHNNQTKGGKAHSDVVADYLMDEIYVNGADLISMTDDTFQQWLRDKLESAKRLEKEKIVKTMI